MESSHRHSFLRKFRSHETVTFASLAACRAANELLAAAREIAGVIPEIDVFQIDYAPMLNGANTLGSVLDAMTAQVLMRPLSATDRTIILDWLIAEQGVGENVPLTTGVPEQAAALVAAVLLSSAYFQLR